MNELSISVSGASTNFVVKIDFELMDLFDGVHFQLSRDAENKIKYFQVCTGNLARCWMPCAEDVPVSWDLRYQIHTEGLTSTQIHHLNTASSGVLMTQFANSETLMKIFHFKLDIPTPADKIAFSIGLFDLVKVPSAPFTIAFCPMGLSNKVTSSIEFFSRAFGFVNNYLGCSSFPYPSYYLVFLKDSGLDYRCNSGLPGFRSAANVDFFDVNCLHDFSIIEQALHTRMLLSQALVKQYFGTALRIEKTADRWLLAGLVGYLARLLLRIFHGHNDFKYNMKVDMEAVMSAEALNQFPALLDLPELLKTEQEKWLQLKSYLLFATLDHRLEKQSLQKIVGTVWSEHLNGRLGGELTTSTFFRIAKKVSGKDMRSFADHWVYQRGSPVFNCSFAFNRKRSTIEMDLKQYTPGFPTRKFAGSLLIRVHEIDGVFDHSVHIDDFSHHFELPVHAKAKKIKKKKDTSQSQGSQADATGIGENLPVNASLNSLNTAATATTAAAPSEVVSNEASGGGVGKEEDGYISPLSWIRLDPEMEWVATLELHQPEYMLVEELQNDRDVVAQYEALLGLRRQPSDTAISVFEKAMLDGKLFYKLRIEAAKALTSLPLSQSHNTLQETNHLGALKVIHWYNKNFALQSTETVVVPVPKSNNFENLQNYFILKSIAPALCQVRSKNVSVMELVGHILLNMMRFNDNSLNPFSDNYYVANMLSSFVRHLQQRRDLGLNMDKLLRDYLRELDRYMTVERVQPYYQNTVMVAIWDAWSQLRSMDLATPNADANLSKMISSGNFVDIRVAALKYLLQSHGLDVSQQSIIPMLLSSIASMLSDSCTSAMKAAIALANSSPRPNPATKAAWGEASNRLALWDLIQGKLANPYIVNHLLQFSCRFIDPSVDDWGSGDVHSKTILRIQLPTATGVGEEVVMDAESTSTLALSGMVDEEPDWFLEVAIEQGVRPRAPTAASVVAAPTPTFSYTIKSRLLSLHSLIWNHYDSFAFHHPVDRAVIGYYDVIKNPMDLSTLKRRIVDGSCASWQQFTEDLRLMFDNCFYFNQPDSLIYDQAKRLRLFSLKEFKKTFPDHGKDIKRLLMTKEPIVAIRQVVDQAGLIDVASHEHEQDSQSVPKSKSNMKRKYSQGQTSTGKESKRRKEEQIMRGIPVKERMLQVWQHMYDHPCAYWFHQPVDPVALNIPTYLDIIKEPMDLSTLRSTLALGDLDGDAAEFYRLLMLIFTNCITFNPSNTIVHRNALEMQKECQKLMKKYLPEVAAATSAIAGLGSGTKSVKINGVNSEVAATEQKIPKLIISSPTKMNKTASSGEAAVESGLKLKLHVLPSNSHNTMASNAKIGDIDSESCQLDNANDGWKEKALGIVDMVSQHEYAVAFLEPVDWKGLKLSTYPRIIRKPTDLSTIRRKIVTLYNRLAEFKSEMHLMFANCYKFNGSSASISLCARALEEFFEQLYSDSFPS